ncbi:hypothetical protein ABZ807_20085 [Micromonospora sp. NPDC047548]|uniref:hypothetical protein n=1 Tax=Micromonospora sp. NPDC047548 TaxID=3155624 RepID=UPI0033FD1CB2
MIPVLERWSYDCPFWPVEQGEFLLPVPRRPTPAQVGTVMWALVGYHVTADDESVSVATATEAVEAYLTSGADGYAAGGLRVTDGRVVVEPGCCVGLDEWRDWLDVLDGRVPDLGHEPDVLLEDRGPVLRLWQDRDALPPGTVAGPDEPHIDIPRDAFSGLLRSVQQDLTGFLGGLREWSWDIVPDLADLLVASVDERLSVTAPLEV